MRIGNKVATCGPPRTATKWLVSVINELEYTPMMVAGKGAHDPERFDDDLMPPVITTIRRPDAWIISMWYDHWSSGKWNPYPCTPEAEPLQADTLAEWCYNWIKSPCLVWEIWDKYLKDTSHVLAVSESKATTERRAHSILEPIYGECAIGLLHRKACYSGPTFPLDPMFRQRILDVNQYAVDFYLKHCKFGE